MKLRVKSSIQKQANQKVGVLFDDILLISENPLDLLKAVLSFCGEFSVYSSMKVGVTEADIKLLTMKLNEGEDRDVVEEAGFVGTYNSEYPSSVKAINIPQSERQGG